MPSSLATSGTVAPAASFASAWRSLRTICSGECRLPIKSPPYARLGLADSHSNWTRFWGAGHGGRPDGQVRAPRGSLRSRPADSQHGDRGGSGRADDEWDWACRGARGARLCVAASRARVGYLCGDAHDWGAHPDRLRSAPRLQGSVAIHAPWWPPLSPGGQTSVARLVRAPATMSIALTQPPGTRVAEAKDSVVQTRNARDTWLSQNWQDFPPRSPSGDPATNRVTLAWSQTWRKVIWQGGRREGDSAV